MMKCKSAKDIFTNAQQISDCDCLCGLVVRVPSCRSRGPGSVLGATTVDLVSTIEELLERKSSGSGLEIREYGRRDPSR
jgi:hypothetical protein